MHRSLVELVLYVEHSEHGPQIGRKARHINMHGWRVDGGVAGVCCELGGAVLRGADDVIVLRMT